MAEQNPLTIRAGELARLPLTERRRIMEIQAENYTTLKAEATRRATIVIKHLRKNLEGMNQLWTCTEPIERDELLFAIEELLDNDAGEQLSKIAPVVP